MFNQLTASSGRRRDKHSSIYKQFLKRSQVNDLMQSKELPRNSSSLREKQQKLMNRLLASSMDGPESDNITETIKARLKSKRIELPENWDSFRGQPTLNIDPKHIRISSNLGYLSNSHHQTSTKTRQKRLKTYANDRVDESQSESVHPYEQTMNEIDDMNRLFFRNNKRQIIKNNDLSIKQSYSSPPRRLHHLSRENDFSKYIDHLEKLQGQNSQYRHSRIIDSPVYFNSPSRPKLPNISPRRDVESKPFHLTPSSSLPYNKHDSFIKILKKVKARGESLLVKLRKFPSNCNLNI